MAALTIARLTIREAARRKLLLALAILTLIVIGLTGWGFQHLTTLTNPDGSAIPASELRLAMSQVLVLVEFMFSGVLALSAVVVASPAISSELESGVALSMLARPVSRYQVVLGKWLGLAALIVVYVAATTTLELIVVELTTGYVPPGPVGLALYLSAEGIVIMSLALLISTRLSGMTAGVISLVLFFLAWIGGIAGAIGEVFGSIGDQERGHHQPAAAAHRRALARIRLRARAGPVSRRARRHHRARRQSLLRSVAAVGRLPHLGGVLGGVDRRPHRLEPPPPRGLMLPGPPCRGLAASRALSIDTVGWLSCGGAR